jgi:hypothetical protein
LVEKTREAEQEGGAGVRVVCFLAERRKGGEREEVRRS